MLTLRQYNLIKPMVEANQADIRNGPNPRDTKANPYPFPKIGNAEYGAIEQFELLRDTPDTFGAYLSSDRKVTTWAGDILAEHIRNVSTWRSNFGDERMAFRFTMGGRLYSARGGGAGMYLSARAIKGPRK